MDSRKVLILGGVGNGSVIAAAIDDANARGDLKWRMHGYLNDRMAAGEDLEGHPVRGTLSDVPRFLDEGCYFINTIYRIDGQERRMALFDSLNIPDDRLATFVHPLTYVARNVELGAGSVVMPNVSISSGVRLGRCCLVMVGATLGHNTVAGDHCHFAAQACVGAYLDIGRGVHIGLNASVRENLVLGESSTLAMGGVLVKNMGAFEVWAGVPARLLRAAERE